MPQTIIKVETYMCPKGIGNLGKNDAEGVQLCRFHRSVDNMTEDGKCPVDGLELEKATLPKDQMTKTIMGEETIEDEILDRDEAKHRAARLAMVDRRITEEDERGEFATDIAKELKRTKKKENVEEEIKLKKDAGFFLTTPIKVKEYRSKRKEDIRLAIIEARKVEDK